MLEQPMNALNYRGEIHIWLAQGKGEGWRFGGPGSASKLQVSGMKNFAQFKNMSVNCPEPNSETESGVYQNQSCR